MGDIMLPERLFYTLNKAASEINRDVYDLFHYISIGMVDVAINIDLSEFIKDGRVFVRGKFNKEIFTNARSKKFRHRSNYSKISEIISCKANGELEYRKVIKACGLFSVRVSNIFKMDADFDNVKEFVVDRLYPVRLPSFTHYNLEDYNPRVILIDDGINIKTSDLVITKSELFLLKNGGVTINWRLNQVKSSMDKYPDFIKSKIDGVNSRSCEALNKMVGKPRNIYRNVIIDVAKATRISYPWSHTTLIINKIHSLLYSVDAVNTPKVGTIRNILCSEGIGKTGVETKADFSLV
ncbi:TPA: hypothetical protein U0A68_001037, partial [Escherichia coli]|nr:hypothetical protein [Escherichia coli]